MKNHKKQKLMKETNDRRAHERPFEAGDSAYMKNFGPGLKWLVGTVHSGPGGRQRVSETRRSY